MKYAEEFKKITKGSDDVIMSYIIKHFRGLRDSFSSACQGNSAFLSIDVRANSNREYNSL